VASTAGSSGQSCSSDGVLFSPGASWFWANWHRVNLFQHPIPAPPCKFLLPSNTIFPFCLLFPTHSGFILALLLNISGAASCVLLSYVWKRKHYIYTDGYACFCLWQWNSYSIQYTRCFNGLSFGLLLLGMKTDRIRTDIVDTIFVFIFLLGFGFEHG